MSPTEKNRTWNGHLRNFLSIHISCYPYHCWTLTVSSLIEELFGLTERLFRLTRVLFGLNYKNVLTAGHLVYLKLWPAAGQLNASNKGIQLSQTNSFESWTFCLNEHFKHTFVPINLHVCWPLEWKQFIQLKCNYRSVDLECQASPQIIF